MKKFSIIVKKAKSWRQCTSRSLAYKRPKHKIDPIRIVINGEII